MALFDSIDKLITERGSALILKERLELAADKYAALETKLKNLTEENVLLQTALDRANSEIKRMAAVVPTQQGRLSEEEEKVLKYFAEKECFCPASACVRHTGISTIKVNYCIEKFRRASLLKTPMVIMDDSPRTYQIAHLGREYVIQHGLLG